MVREQQQTLSLFGDDYTQRVENALSQLKQGKGILLVDDENRENEGDLIFSAEHITEAQMALMIRECSGIVCLCITTEQADQLALQPMVVDNTSRFKTAFTVSIEAREGVTTGVSAADRVQTIRTACAPEAQPDDLARPGHVFPLLAAPNGVLARAGHTEGSVDLMRLAGLAPQAVLCELTNEDGTMARLPQIITFAQKHALSVLSVEDIIQYRTFVTDY
ncbi:MAG: 3,4-dihydroxy-2-butanone-4-phosphate synthase [Bacteroidota bacterium]